MNEPAPVPRGLLALLAFVIVFLAGGMSFRGLPDTQIFRSDEGFYHLEARRLIAQVEACRTIFEIFRNERPTGLLRLDPARTKALEELVNQGYGTLGGRFLHDVFVALSLVVVGPYDWAGNALAALFGLATLVLAGVWARVLFGESAAVYAAALGASSVLWLVYSRCTLAETDLAFFVTLCLFFHTLSLKRESYLFCALAGAAFGLGFLTSLRAVPVAYAVVAIEVVSRPWRRIVPSLVMFGLGALVPLAIAEAFFHALFLFSAYSGVLLARHTLAMNVVWLFFRFNGGVVSPGAGGAHLYPRFVGGVENPVFLVLGALGLLVAAWRAWGDRAVRPLVVAFVVAGAYWQFAVSIKALRYLSMLLPLCAVLGAAACVALERRLAAKVPAGAFVVVASALIVASGVPRGLAALPTGPSYREVADYLIGRGAPKIVASQINVFRVWFEGDRVESANTFEELKALHARGYRYYVSCFQKYHQTTTAQVLQFEAQLSRFPVEAEFAHPRGGTWHTWFEGGVLAPIPGWASDATRIRVWDLDRVFAEQH